MAPFFTAPTCKKVLRSAHNPFSKVLIDAPIIPISADAGPLSVDLPQDAMRIDLHQWFCDAALFTEIVDGGLTTAPRVIVVHYDKPAGADFVVQVYKCVASRRIEIPPWPEGESQTISL